MEQESIQLPKQLMNSIREIVKRTRIYQDEQDFIQQAVMKHLTKFKEI